MHAGSVGVQPEILRGEGGHVEGRAREVAEHAVDICHAVVMRCVGRVNEVHRHIRIGVVGV